MKFFLIALTLFCSSCSALDVNLKNAISYGEIRDLSEYTPEIEKKLFIRLFHAPIHSDDCFKETHGICQYKYFLSVSTFDEYPETNIYELETLGEIDSISWMPISGMDKAKLKLTLNKYTKEALLNNSLLINKRYVVNIVVTPKELTEVLASKGRASP